MLCICSLIASGLGLTKSTFNRAKLTSASVLRKPEIVVMALERASVHSMNGCLSPWGHYSVLPNKVLWIEDVRIPFSYTQNYVILYLFECLDEIIIFSQNCLRKNTKSSVLDIVYFSVLPTPMNSQSFCWTIDLFWNIPDIKTSLRLIKSIEPNWAWRLRASCTSKNIIF